jgi:hypothetical protein
MHKLVPIAAALLPALSAGQDVLVTLPEGQVLTGDAVLGGLTPLASLAGPVGDGALVGASLWVGCADGQVWEVEKDGTTSMAFTVAGGAAVLARDGSALLAAGSDGFVRRVDPATGQVLETYAAPNDVTTLYHSVAAGRLAGTASGLLLREIGGTFQQIADLGGEVPAGVVEFEFQLFLATTSGTIQRRALGGTLLGSFELGVMVSDLHEHLTDLLVTTQDGRLLRVDRETGAVLDEESLGGVASSIAVEDDPWIGLAYCYGNDCPCGNEDRKNGCENSTGLGGYLLASGSTSIEADDLTLVLTHMPPNSFHVLIMGQSWSEMHLGDGMLCVDVSSATFRFPVSQSSSVGFDVLGPGLVDFTHQSFGEPGRIDPGETWHFQNWYRDSNGPCGSGFSVTNAYTILFEL